MAIAGGRFRVLVDRYNDRLDVLVAIALAGSPAGWQGCWLAVRADRDRLFKSKIKQGEDHFHVAICCQT